MNEVSGTNYINKSVAMLFNSAVRLAELDINTLNKNSQGSQILYF
jgi:hypothetical protein